MRWLIFVHKKSNDLFIKQFVLCFLKINKLTCVSLIPQNQQLKQHKLMSINYKKIYKKNTKYKNKSLKQQITMFITTSSQLLVTLILACAMMLHVECITEMSNFMIMKNNKIVALGVGSRDNSLWERKVWVQNDQDSIKVEVPVNHRQQGRTQQYPIGQYDQFLPIFYSHLTNRGYLRPQDPFTQQQSNTKLIKGYKLLKPAYSQSQPQAQTQLKTFLQTLLTHQNLTFLNLRLEDTFSLQLTYVPEQQAFRVVRYQIRYLFATLGREELPEGVLGKVTIVEDLQGKMGSVERRLTGRGLHQWVNMTLVLEDKIDVEIEQNKEKCSVQFTDILPESTYIDADQRRQYTTNYEVINVQKPTFASKQYFYKFKLPFSQFHQSGVHSYTYQQPMHFRYPSPSLLNYTKIYLHSIEQVRIVCQHQKAQQKMYDLKENKLFERGTAYIPHADVSKSRVVSITTLAVCLIAVLIILQQLKRN